MTSLFPDPEPEDPPPQAALLVSRLRTLAKQGTYQDGGRGRGEGVSEGGGLSMKQSRKRTPPRIFTERAKPRHSQLGTPCRSHPAGTSRL
jgi:hypothetical protein